MKKYINADLLKKDLQSDKWIDQNSNIEVIGNIHDNRELLEVER